MNISGYEYLDPAEWDLRCSHSDCKNNPDAEYCPCPQMIVATYGDNVIDIEIREPITPWKSNYHTVIRMDRDEARFLHRQLERFLHGFSPKPPENRTGQQD